MTIEAATIALTGVDIAFLLGAAAVAGAVIGAAIVFYARRRSTPVEEPIRRGPSPASVGLDDDPIVAALVGPRDDARGRRVGNRPRERDIP